MTHQHFAGIEFPLVVNTLIHGQSVGFIRPRLSYVAVTDRGRWQATATIQLMNGELHTKFGEAGVIDRTRTLGPEEFAI